MVRSRVHRGRGRGLLLNSKCSTYTPLSLDGTPSLARCRDNFIDLEKKVLDEIVIIGHVIGQNQNIKFLSFLCI